MKKFTFLLVLIVLIINSISYSQNQDSIDNQSSKDSTKFKMGDKEIIIIEKQDDGKAKEKSKLEFKAKIQALQMEQDNLKNQPKTTENEEKIKDLDAQIKALEKGLKEVEEETPRWERPKKDRKFRRFANRDFGGHWAGFEFGLNNFVDKNFANKMPVGSENLELKDSKSWEFALNFYEYDFTIIKNVLGVVTGMGIQWNNYRFEKNISLIEDANGVIYGGNEATNPNFTKNTLNTTYLNVPLIVEVHIPTDKKPINIGLGIVGGVKLFSKTVQKYEENSKSHKNVERSDYQLSTFRYGGTFRIGYRGFQFYSNCSLVPLFKKDKGAEIYPFTVGFSISFN